MTTLNNQLPHLLLTTASQLLPKHGWKHSIYAALIENNLDLSPSCLSGLFADGQDVALAKFVREQQCNEQMLLRMRQDNIINHSKDLINVNEEIKSKLNILLEGFFARNEFISNKASLWPEAVSIVIKASPKDFFISHPLNTANMLLHMSNLKFSDLEWYSMRALIVQILLSSEAMICATNYVQERDSEDLKNFVKGRIQSYYLSKHSLSMVIIITNTKF